ncbi:hypothetical protein DM826_07720 [Halonotius aquaticus]|uniref:Uncharacterized protein n=1 Tax=Halonotius aquaticus TaxID=2216978 RepID=A0A3A6Q7F6_9EURY|nr:hypothetical protein DM826_07720 [Halonotius aquaticus]
MYIRFSVSVC